MTHPIMGCLRYRVYITLALGIGYTNVFLYYALLCSPDGNFANVHLTCPEAQWYTTYVIVICFCCWCY